MSYYIGADLGTSSLKLMLVDKAGKILKSATREYEVTYPKIGWSEQNPYDWWDAFVSGVRELTAEFDGGKVQGIGVGGQMHGLVALDKSDKVIRPAILWNDGRTEKEVDYLNNVIGQKALSEMTANVAFAGFTAPKLLWMRENEPENFAKITKIMLPKDYINYLLTGNHATDLSDASGMLTLDVKNRCWSEKMLEICGIERSWCAKLYESYEVIGKVKADVAQLLGISKNAVVVAGAGDNAAAAIGTATVGEGKCNISLGTSGTVFISSESFSCDSNNALHSFCHSDGGYHLMGCILSAASCNKWFCEKILGTSDFRGESDNIDESKLGGNNVFFLPYLMGERSPINDTNATGVFLGLNPETSRADMLLAVFEGVAFAIRDNIEVAKSLGIKLSRSTVCGGGAKSKLWLKILANVLAIELDVPTSEEGPGYGGAILAMTACGEFASVKDGASKLVKIKETVRPEEKLTKLYEERYQKYKKIYPALKALYKEIKE
ncbi:MAG: xylulokinase [Clostridia bacterium]|nr:xylulokinase [Clostridia bacterium]